MRAGRSCAPAGTNSRTNAAASTKAHAAIRGKFHTGKDRMIVPPLENIMQAGPAWSLPALQTAR
jgi:hypothetical protein